MSINPGIRVRPPPLIMRVLLVRSTGIGSVEIFSILLPRDRTLVGFESPADLPAKTRTSSKSTALGCESCAGEADTNQPKINRDRTTSVPNGVANRRGSKAPLFIHTLLLTILGASFDS